MRAYNHRGWRMGVWSACLLTIAASGVVAVRAQSQDDVKRQIQAELDRSIKCLCSKDFDGYAKGLSTDYRRIDFFGDTTDREKSLSEMKALVDPADNIQVTSTIEGIKVKGDQATVLVRMKGSANSKISDGKPVPVKWEDREVQVWTKTPDGWRMKDSMGLTQSVLVDDKPFTPETSDEAAAARTAIQSSYNGLVRAMVEGDSEAFGKLVPNDFVYFPLQGGASQKRGEFLASMKSLFETKGGTADFKLERALLKGDTAVVLGTLRIERQETLDNQPTKTTTTLYERDVWKKTDKGWEPVEFHPLLRERSVGGKIGEAIYTVPAPK